MLKRTSVDGALGFGYLQGDYVRVFDLLTGINLSKIKMQYSKIIFLPHRISFSFLIGREPWEMRVHTTARVMNPCRECLWSIYCRLAPRKKTFFSVVKLLILLKLNHFDGYKINKEGKQNWKEINGNKTQSHDWTKKAPKPCEVKEVAQGLGKTSSNYWLWNAVLFDFSWNIAVIMVQSGLKL